MLLYVYVYAARVHACEGRKRGSDSLGLELQLIATHLTLVLGTMLESLLLSCLFSLSNDY